MGYRHKKALIMPHSRKIIRFIKLTDMLWGVGDMNKPKVVILCGGKGTRLREHTEFIPKALVKVGDMPVIWHVMKTYSHYGYKDFVLCLGYKGDMIKEYFLNLEFMENDFTLSLKSKAEKIIAHEPKLEEWNITFADTGLETPTGGRAKKIEKYIKDETFFLTYCDGLSNVDINKLYKFHKQKGKIATLTAVHPTSRFGIIGINNGIAISFKEKPYMEGVINGGFFVFNRKVFDYLDNNSVLEEEPLRKLTKEGQLAVYEHKNFWGCMDTFKDVEMFNSMWDKNNRPWVIWKD